MSDNRPIVYKENDRWVFRASSVGSSIRELVAAMSGYDALPAPDYLAAAAEAGNTYEMVAKAMLRDRGYRISGEQHTIEIPVGDDAVIRGHLDAWHIVDPDNVDSILEVKSMSDTVFTKWVRQGFDAFYTYATQLACYMEAADRPAVYAVVNRDTNQLLTMNLTEPPVPFAEVRKRVNMALGYYAEGGLPPCDRKSPYPCPYNYLCDFADEEIEKLAGEPETALTKLGVQYDQARLAEKLAGERKKELADEIKLALGTRSKVSAGGFLFSQFETTRRRLDETALRQELGTKLDQFYTTSTSTVLRVKEKKDG